MALVIKVAKQSYSRFQTVKALKDKLTSQQASTKQQVTPPVPENLTLGLEAKQVRAVKFAATRMSEGQELAGQVQFHTEFDSCGKREEYRDVTYVEKGFIVHNYSAYGHHHQNAFSHESTGTLFKFENGAWTSVRLRSTQTRKVQQENGSSLQIQQLSTTFESVNQVLLRNMS